MAAIRYATRAASRSECFYGYENYGEPDAPLQMDYFFWVLDDGTETVLVDTGFDPGVGERRGRTCLCPPLDALAKLGIEQESVSQIILTHLHYDHVGNLRGFPEAELVVQRRELDFWTGPLAQRHQIAAHAEADELAEIVRAQEQGRVRCLDGSEAVRPGISAVLVGGHTPGLQVILVDGRQGPVVLASDALHYYEELEADRPFELFVSLDEMYEAYDTLRELSARPGAVLVAGHDPLVGERFPALAGGGEGLGFRVA